MAAQKAESAGKYVSTPFNLKQIKSNGVKNLQACAGVRMWILEIFGIFDIVDFFFRVFFLWGWGKSMGYYL